MTGLVAPVSIYFLPIQHTLYPIIHYDSTVGMPICEVEFEQQASECSPFIFCIVHVKVNSLPRADRFNHMRVHIVSLICARVIEVWGGLSSWISDSEQFC